MTRRGQVDVVANAFSKEYTEALAGRTVESVEHYHYGALTVVFTDGTRFSFTPSGAPTTIFIDRVRPKGPKARVLRGSP
jgi:hypothetical protein